MNIPELIIKGLLFGIALAMDAFSVSLANGLHDINMSRKKMFTISGTFALFQAAMPLIGWICIHTVIEYFTAFKVAIPYIALVLLVFIGGKMIYEALGEIAEQRSLAKVGIAPDKCDLDSDGNPKATPVALGFGALVVQGIATSIDALSVGFDIAELSFPEALTEAIVIAAATFVICTAGVIIGKKFGTRLAGKATILGGVILIAIGLEIFISSFF